RRRASTRRCFAWRRVPRLPTSTHHCCASSSPSPSRSAASSCATRSAAGSKRAALQATSTFYVAQKKSRSTNTSPSPLRSPKKNRPRRGRPLPLGGRGWGGSKPDARSARRSKAARGGYAAVSHLAVSKALLINGIFAPKLLFAAVLAALTGLSLPLTLVPGATSVARSHDPFSWERATEKNRSTGMVLF